MPNHRRHPHNVDTTPPKLTEAQQTALDQLVVLRSTLDNVVDEIEECLGKDKDKVAGRSLGAAWHHFMSGVGALEDAVHASTQISP